MEITAVRGGYSLNVLGPLIFINYWVVSFVEPGLIYTMLSTPYTASKHNPTKIFRIDYQLTD